MAEKINQRRVVCAAIRLATGRIILGARHWDQHMHAQADQLERIRAAGAHGKEEQGFIDQFGDFMLRDEAWVVAEAAGQILYPSDEDGGRLFSEHLY